MCHHEMKVAWYDTIRYIYVRSKADEMASLIYCMAQKRKIRKNKS